MGENQERKTMLLFNMPEEDESHHQPKKVETKSISPDPVNVNPIIEANNNETVFLGNIYEKEIVQSTMLMGWLVEIAGKKKGQIFKIKKNYNVIGRHMDYEIPLLYDQAVSRSKCAILEKKGLDYVLMPQDIKGHVYLNRKIILKEMILKPNDVITVGETELLFIPYEGDYENS